MTLGALAIEFKRNLGLMYGDDEAHTLFLIAIDHYLKIDRSTYQFKKENDILPNDVVKLKQVLQELLRGKPIQYILGETLFYGLKFKVNAAVLIPRPETEELVEWILEKVKSSELGPNSYRDGSIELPTLSSPLQTILDIGTGSGCIAISLKKNLPEAKVYALDISAESLKVAKENAVLNQAEVEFVRQDILENPVSVPEKSSLWDNTQYTILVSNPPYIKANEKPTMYPNVLDHEPHQALFVSNENPLIFYEAIANLAFKILKNDGLLFFEINEHLGEETVNLLKDKGFKNIVLKKDMQGKDRMIKAEMPIRQPSH